METDIAVRDVASREFASREFADVTVIIPAYRAATTIGRALASVAAQTILPRTAIIVDDGSPDGTQAIAAAHRPHMNGVELIVIHQERAGAGAARNRAIQHARTRYIAFLDADDEWLAPKIERSMAVIEATDAVLVAHDSFEIREGRETRLNCAQKFETAKEAPYAELYRRGYIDTSTVVVRRDAVEAVGGFDTTLPNAQDLELWLAVLQKPGTPFVVFDEALSRYHITAGSIMSHIERRRRCCMTIARSYATALRAHPGSALASLWFRTLAVHYEVAMAHRAKADRTAACITLLRVPGSLVWATAGYLCGRPLVRHRELA